MPPSAVEGPQLAEWRCFHAERSVRAQRGLGLRQVQRRVRQRARQCWAANSSVAASVGDRQQSPVTVLRHDFRHGYEGEGEGEGGHGLGRGRGQGHGSGPGSGRRAAALPATRLLNGGYRHGTHGIVVGGRGQEGERC